MLEVKTCCGSRNPGTLIVLPFRSRTARTCSEPNSSKQPLWIPARITSGARSSRLTTRGPLKFSARSTFPVATASVKRFVAMGTYSTCVNPSSRRRSSARYRGEMQMAGLRTSRMRVVSGGGSAAASSGHVPASPIAPASVSPPTNSRRLQLLRRSLMETFSAERRQLVNRRMHEVGDAIQPLAVPRIRDAAVRQVGERHAGIRICPAVRRPDAAVAERAR